MSRLKCTNKLANIQQIIEGLAKQANKRCQFSQRDTALNEVRFVQVLVLGWLGEAQASLNELAQLAGELGCHVTAAAIHDRCPSDGIKRMARTLVDQLIEIMPELKDVSPWHTFGQRRSLDDYGRVVERRLSDDLLEVGFDED